MRTSPMPRLVAGLVATLLTVAVFGLYALWQLDGLRQLQKNTIDRNRADSLQLLRIQNTLNATGVLLARVYEGRHQDPTWEAELRHIRRDFERELRTENSLVSRPENRELVAAFESFWNALEELAATGQEKPVGAMRYRTHLELTHHRLIEGVGALLVRNQEAEAQAVTEIAAIYDRVERNVYLFAVAMLVIMGIGGATILSSTRKLFREIGQLSDQRSTLAKKLIGLQEEVFRSVARELHDEFGQILTALGAMLRRVEKRHGGESRELANDLREVKQVAQEALDQVRGFSQALHPTLLDDYGLDRAIDKYVPAFSKHTGIAVNLEKDGCPVVPEEKAIHIYRVLQEALTNVAKHSKASKATVRLRYRSTDFGLEVEDDGVGIQNKVPAGLGLTGMRERAELVHGDFEVKNTSSGGTLVRLRIPLEEADQ